MAAKRVLGVWAVGDRQTVETVQYEKDLGKGRGVMVLKIERVRSVKRGWGFRPGAMNMVLTPLEIAKLVGGGKEYWIASESYSEPGSLYPITGKMVESFNHDKLLRYVRHHKLVKTRTTKVVKGKYEVKNHVPVEETPLGKLRFPKPGRKAA